MEALNERLRRVGLTGNETKLYLELLKRGELNGSELAKKVGMDRSLTYTVLNNLIDKGLVSYIVKGNIRAYMPLDPENLLADIEQKEKEVKSLIPDLKAIQKLASVSQAVTVYEGKKGLKVLMDKMVRTSKELLFFGGTGRSYDVLRWEMPHLEKLFIKEGYSLRGVMNRKYSGHRMTSLGNIRFLDDVDSDATTTIFGNHVAIHVLLPDEKPLIILIENKNIAESYRNYFEVLWKAAKK